jgi:hypothetical protein
MAVHREGRLEENLRRYQRALPGALTAAGKVVVTRTHRIFVLFRPRGWATGHTVRSLTVSPPYMDGRYMKVKVGPTTKYSWWLHFGRGPGKMPPIQNILDWVKEKHIAGTYRVVGTHRGRYPRYERSGGRAQREREDLDTAWAIARAIARKGTKPFPFLIVGFRQSKGAALQVFRRALMQGVAQEGLT